MSRRIRACALLLPLLLAAAPHAAAQSLYWERPKTITDPALDCRYPASVSGVTRRSASAVFWEEVDKKRHEIYLSLCTTRDGITWSEGRHFAGPFAYSGEAPEIYSVANNSRGQMAAAVLSGTNEITVYQSADGGRTFEPRPFPPQEAPLVGPRIFATSGGGFVIFATLATNESFSLAYASSPDGAEWTDFQPLGFDYPRASNPLVPYLAALDGGTDLLAFQAHYASGSRLTFQIFICRSGDGGQTWSPPVMVTEAMPGFEDYNNQRPMIHQARGGTYLAWERSPFGAASASAINVCAISPEGEALSAPEIVSTTGSAVHPVLFSFGRDLYCVWSDSQASGNRVFMAQRLRAFWGEPQVIIQNIAASTFPVSSAAGKELSFVWQQLGSSGGGYQVAMLLKDSTCQPPEIRPLNFASGEPLNADAAEATLIPTEDSSGIMGFSCVWTRDPEEEPPEDITNMPQEADLSGAADEDGAWYFRARQVDYAGNWSEASTAAFIRDSTPPLAPVLGPLPLDGNTLAEGNTFRVEWDHAPGDADVTGYTWALEYIAPIPRQLAVNATHPLRLSEEEVAQAVRALYEENAGKLASLPPLPSEPRSGTEDAFLPLGNYYNGLYAFTVAAIDHVGNVGPPVTATFVLNRYAPATYVTAITPEVDAFGDLSMDIIGGGFTYEGTITAVYLDADRQAPYDYVLTSRAGGYTVASGSRITGITLPEIEAGTYYVGLVHSDRGLYFTRQPLLDVREHGTVKTFAQRTFSPAWLGRLGGEPRSAGLSALAAAALGALGAAAFAAACRGLAAAAREAALIRSDIYTLTRGGTIMPKERKARARTLRRRGISLRAKLILNTMALIVILSAAMVLALGYVMTRREEVSRVQGLRERVGVVLDSMTTGAQINLPNAASNLLALGDLADGSRALSDANFAVITGYPASGGDGDIDHIWATNDPDISSKLDGPLMLGSSRLRIDGIRTIADSCTALNGRAAAAVQEMAGEIATLTAEGVSLAGRSDAESQDRRREIADITRQLNRRVDAALDAVAAEGTGSLPRFSGEGIDYENTTYLFYKPVIYHRGAEERYVHGIVFLEISTQSLIDEIHNARLAIARTSAVIMALALALGLASSALMASIIVSPINKLAQHVAMIRDTDDKETLSGRDIAIRSHDEIGMLGDTVNEMTRGLAAAAVQAKNLTFGKEVQARFIPLQTDAQGNALTTGSLRVPGLELFSYYAGADDLSGDYFDYKRLDEHHYAIIKCDVSGHGVPAALIMVEVATLFLNAFRSWDMASPAQGTNLPSVVRQINDMLESRGFKGRFAAFTLAIINARTGDCWFCNAGDSLVQIYDGAAGRKKTVALPETPAAGMFSTDMVDMKGGYRVVKIRLKKGDVLFLYTDGIEEAKRSFRGADGSPAPCAEPGLRPGDPHGTHKAGEEAEELTPERVTDIIESVYARRPYVLRKYHAPADEAELTFDFSACAGTAEDAIMALVSIEKVFRLYRGGDAGASGRVKADKKIDDFLRLCFREYGLFCLDSAPCGPTHVWWNGVREDAQYDDLTLVAIKKE